MRKLFLLEDDLSLISGLTFAFKKQGFALDTARTLAEAEVLWSDRKYDLLVLDVSLPDGSGFDFCQRPGGIQCKALLPECKGQPTDQAQIIFQKEQFSHDSLSFLRFVCPTGSKAL